MVNWATSIDHLIKSTGVPGLYTQISIDFLNFLCLYSQILPQDKVIGFLVFRFRQRSLCILQLAVAKDARGRGVGRSLLRWAAREAGNPGKNREESLEKRWIFHGKMGGYIGKHQGKIMNSALFDGKHGKVNGNKLLFSLLEGQWTIHL